MAYEDGGPPTILGVNDTAVLPLGVMHTVSTKSQHPACYMYTYIGMAGTNSTLAQEKEVTWNHLLIPFEKSLVLVGQSILSLVFGIPLVRHN